MGQAMRVIPKWIQGERQHLILYDALGLDIMSM